MKLLILKTDINSPDHVNKIRPLFDNNPIVFNWSVDLQDIDYILRVEASDHLLEEDLIYLIQKYGFSCEELQG